MNWCECQILMVGRVMIWLRLWFRSSFVAVVDMFLRTQDLVQGGESSQGLKNIDLSQLGRWLG